MRAGYTPTPSGRTSMLNKTIFLAPCHPERSEGPVFIDKQKQVPRTIGRRPRNDKSGRRPRNDKSGRGQIPRRYAPRDDESVSNRCDASRLALGRIRHLRIPRSAEVSASENAGRVNKRSAYFISGAACFGIWIP